MPERLSAREFVERSPEGTLFTRTGVLELLDSAGEVAEGSPGQVAKLLGRSAKYWRAVAPTIDGAYQEDSGRWRLPLPACRAHLARKRAKTKEGPRGPHRKAKAKTAQTGRAGATRVPPRRPVLVGRPETVGRHADSAQGSEAPGLAFGRSANG